MTPLTYKPTADGFQVDEPLLSESAEVVTQIHTPALTLSSETSKDYIVSNYDDLRAEISHRGGSGTTAYTTQLVRGVPFVHVKATEQQSFTLLTDGVISQQDNGATLVVRRGERAFVLRGASFSANDNTVRITLAAGSWLSIGSLPAGMEVAEFTRYATPITKTAVTYASTGKGVRTTLSYSTEGSGETLLLGMPHQRTIDAAPLVKDAYRSLYGTHALYTGNKLVYTTPKPTLTQSLASVTKLPAEQQDLLREQLKKDADANEIEAFDTYFGGKELYRTAQLLQLSSQLDMPEQESKLRTQLIDELDTWLEANTQPRSIKQFYYDEQFRGIVGEEASFGAENFNDHHFHYGYFLQAISVAARYDDNFVERHGPVVQSLVADIANEDSDKYLRLRSFDAYAGHSWASGFSDFETGNNQESISEAINAWIGIYHWAELTGNKQLQERAQWLYSNEVSAAQKYWFLEDSPYAAEYSAPFVSLVWGGKRDYATFFSPRPQAKLGILLLPMSPGHQYQIGSEQKTAELLSSTLPTDADYNGQFGDYLAMLLSTIDPQKAERIATDLPDDAIDSANSRTYMWAWIFTRP